MSTVAGHALAAVAAYEALRRPCRLAAGWPARLGVAALAVVPDLDVFTSMIWPRLSAHRGFSHSLAFAAILALAAAPLLVKGRGALVWLVGWLGLVLVCLAHPLLDYLMACGPAVPIGWPLWPGAHLSPIQLVPTAYYSRSLSGLAGLLRHGPTLRAVGLEVVMFLPLALLAGGATRGRGWGWKLVLLLVSAAGWGATLVLYGGWDRLRLWF